MMALVGPVLVALGVLAVGVLLFLILRWKP